MKKHILNEIISYQLLSSHNLTLLHNNYPTKFIHIYKKKRQREIENNIKEQNKIK